MNENGKCVRKRTLTAYQLKKTKNLFESRQKIKKLFCFSIMQDPQKNIYSPFLTVKLIA
jgi:hypothetical protein